MATSRTGRGPISGARIPIPIWVRAGPECRGPRARAALELGGKERDDPHLRSSRAVTGYHIQATDGDLGHVEDFIVDDHSWTIRYMVLDTTNWWPGKKVLVAPDWIER